MFLPASWLSAPRAFSARKYADTTTATLTDQQKEEFLRTAKITVSKELGVGINNTRQATLTDGTTTRYAHIQSVDIRKPSFATPSGTELNFRDSYKYNIAAYKLDRLLGLDHGPRLGRA